MVAYEQRVVKSKALKASMKEVNVHLEQQRAENTALSRQCNAATADAQDLRVRVEALTTERAKWEEDLAHARFAEEEARSLHAGASQECNRIKEDLASAHEACLSALHAQCIGVQPLLSGLVVSSSAPTVNSHSQTGRWPFWQATCIGVWP